MDDGRIGHAELQIGDGVLYLADEYPELGLKAPDPQAISVSLMLHVADTDVTLERARERGARQREPYENYGTPQRHDHRPVRAPVDAQRAGHRRAGAASSTATSATSRCGRPTPTAPRPSTATCWAGPTTQKPIRSPTPRSTSASTPSTGPPPCSAATRWPISMAPGEAILAGGGTVDEIEAVRLRHAARRNRFAGHVVRGIPAESGYSPVRAQRHWAGRTFVHHVRGDRLDGVQGVLQPRAVLDLRARPHRRRLAGPADTPDGRGRRR